MLMQETLFKLWESHTQAMKVVVRETCWEEEGDKWNKDGIKKTL